MAGTKPNWHYCMFFCFLLCSQAGMGRTDSLHYARLHAADHADRMHAAVLLAETLLNANPDSAFTLLNEASALSHAANPMHQADYFNILGMYYWNTGQHEEAIAQFKQTMSVRPAKDLENPRAWASNSIGTLYSFLSQADSARKYLELSLQIDTERNNRYGITKNMYDLGRLFFNQDQYELALRYLMEVADFQTSVQDTFRLMHTKTMLGNVFSRIDSTDKAIANYHESAELASFIGQRLAEAYAYNNLAGIYCDLPGKLDTTLYFVEKGLAIAEEYQDYPSLITLNVNAGEAYLHSGDLDEALSWYLKAYTYYENINIPRVQMDLLIRMGRIYKLLGHPDSSRKFLNDGLELALMANSLRNQSTAYFYLASLDSLDGNFQAALMNYQKGGALRDSISNKESRSRIAELQIIHETEKSRLAITELQQKDRISKIFIRSGMIFIVMGMLVVFFFFKYIQKRRKLAEQQIKLHQSDMQKMGVLLNANKQELTGKALSLVKSDELITQLKSDLQKLLPRADMNTSHELRSALRLLKSNEKNQALWEEFEQRFDELNDGFISKLVKRYPDLTPGEIRMCAMLRLQFSSKEIAELSKRSYRTIEYVRSNIRKKMDLKAGENLTKHILNI